MKKLEIFNEVKGWKVPRKKLFRAFGAFLREEGVKEMEVVLVFIGEAKMRRLNETWRGGKGSTDVLSFSLVRPGHKLRPAYVRDVGAEIYICVKVAKVAERYLKVGKSLSSEVLDLFVHGLLHLAGYTHENERKLEKMMKRADEIIDKLL